MNTNVVVSDATIQAMENELKGKSKPYVQLEINKVNKLLKDLNQLQTSGLVTIGVPLDPARIKNDVINIVKKYKTILILEKSLRSPDKHCFDVLRTLLYLLTNYRDKQ